MFVLFFVTLCPFMLVMVHCCRCWHPAKTCRVRGCVWCVVVLCEALVSPGGATYTQAGRPLCAGGRCCQTSEYAASWCLRLMAGRTTLVPSLSLNSIWECTCGHVRAVGGHANVGDFEREVVQLVLQGLQTNARRWKVLPCGRSCTCRSL
jgi:hypothetical protein